MTDPTTRRAEAIALAKRVSADLDHFCKRADSVSLMPSDLRTLCNAVLEAPADEGAALRRLRSEMQDAWLACIENKKLFNVGSPDRREWQAEANAFQSACFAIDRELAALRAKDPQ